ncbi:MAG: hypothetical protein OEO20_11505 [Gemmatimonadota bacterium]|nr:hypothetical protein [Gemmatimonadota bacterium]MDH3366531.1 hypothetical protein [Gemmatimonadota bacterium]MDH3478920.1 hypothetical protein [Gemmatimonadota bacterium]
MVLEIALWILLGILAGLGLAAVLHERILRAERAQWMAFIERGVFDKVPAKSYRPETAEERIDQAAKTIQTHWSQQSVARGVSDLADTYRAEGLPVPKRSDLKREVELMLNAAAQGEAAIDV